MEKKNIVIIGLGGVGGYFGFKINQLNEKENQFHITFVARSKTFDIVKENGLTLLSPEHPNIITKPNEIIQSISEIGNSDLVLICVKEYDLENVCEQLKQVISPNTILLPLMNGVDIYDRIRKIIPENTILPACVYVASHIKEKGIVEHKGKAGKLIFGKDPANIAENVDWIIKLMTDSGIDFDFKENSFADIWTKFIFVASFGLVSAKYNSSIGTVCEDSAQKQEATAIMKEVKAIADKKAITLPNDIIEKTFEKASTFPPSTPTSLQLDINVKQQNNELELFAGAIIHYGKELGIETPSTQKIHQELTDKIQQLSL
ncbi:2-dehydropantoate 2-reductase [Epilithonimonas ginsengisoli]|uniref:2-dehydropantoate 2-reductase n=1 Tax=Epilithonimonas ginsengisoli TaxID=1245592 RepID=A0ABU4JD37_9FLAO|nr:MULTISPECIES: 2-dehydropantoate 2-reductase [Chryseobacterium group]MBV6878557.1 2-dehydropantoate 2-reductase [Epilithonimonas sp. FP105]MDW8547582.1 2-dehydropantoate 2-reductase [Epilithonimonas ginsengisoli]OAH75181.1 2-dehydropantoate 2-reductase [Chryseobacterium sp. FP211-J200]